MRWYTLAAKSNYAPAQAALGDMYSMLGIANGTPDYDSAIKWYAAAAEAGYPYGQYSLGLAILEGHGTKADPKTAALWFKRAAYKGYRPAQYEIGRLYFLGEGVMRNDIYAYGWLSISVSDNTDITPEILTNLVDRMDPDFRDRAVQLESRYRDRFGTPDRDNNNRFVSVN